MVEAMREEGVPTSASHVLLVSSASNGFLFLFVPSKASTLSCSQKEFRVGWVQSRVCGVMHAPIQKMGMTDDV